MALPKILMLGSLAFRRPQEFWDRTLAILSVRVEQFWVRPGVYVPTELGNLLTEVSAILGTNLEDILKEPQLAVIEQEVTARVQDLVRSGSAPFTVAHNADFSMARVCYGICRALKPRIVVETGVAYGVTSAFILKALETNDRGALHSIDLPPLARDGDRFVGTLIPEELKERWNLYRGVSKKVLPGLLVELGEVEFFLHDSLHTYANIKRELNLVAPYLTRPAVVIADDVQENNAFLEWAQRRKPDYWATVRQQQKEAMFGVAILR